MNNFDATNAAPGNDSAEVTKSAGGESPSSNGSTSANGVHTSKKVAGKIKASAPKKKVAKRSPTAKSASAEAATNIESRGSEQFANWNFPKNSLEEAIRVAQALEEKFAGKPTPSEELAKAVSFKKVTDWRWKDLLRSANAYGLVKGTGAAATVSMQDIGADVVAPKVADERKSALIRAFENVAVFKAVSDHYGNKPIPDDEYFANTLVREFEIVRDRVSVFIEVYKANVQYIGTFKGAAAPHGRPGLSAISPVGLSQVSTPVDDAQLESREFLGTAFVLMPFGHPYDRCWEEVYKRSIKEAGLEPFRADGLFNSGTVIEQIWEQIGKAEVLLAEVTGKNANVFYELGLAHAIAKPVILISSSLDDVPFDLRHLRVIIYDVYDPHWGDKLRKSIVDFVKSARKDPSKSVPQPFRDLAKQRAGDESPPNPF